MTFRAIIIGGGPNGLAMARALQLAGIDYVLLERNPDMTPESGFGISLYPQSMRLLDQFGLLEEGRLHGWEYRYKHNYAPDGSEVETNQMFDIIKEYHGHPWLYLSRRRLLQMLYKSNPDRDTKLRAGTKVTNIHVHEKGVEVTCDDGSVEKGSIVIGCDGIRSIARTEMDRLEREATGRAANPPRPFYIEYKAVIGRSPIPEGLELGHVYETRGKQQSYQLLTSPLGMWWFAYRRVDKDHEEKRYTAEDAEALVELSRSDVVGPGGFTFGQLWDTRTSGGLWDLHEGSLKKWYHGGRIVLVGDSVHKFSPTAGNGLNTGWQGVSVVANLLRREIMKNPEPDSESLEKAYESYQSERAWPTKIAETMSLAYPRTISWHNFGYRIIEWMAPYLGGDSSIFKVLSNACVSTGVILEYAEESDLPPGTKPWKNPPIKLGKGDGIAADKDDSDES